MIKAKSYSTKDIDFAPKFWGDLKVSKYLNYLAFRAGIGMPGQRDTWFETKKEIQVDTHLSPDEQDRVRKLLCLLLDENGNTDKENGRPVLTVNRKQPHKLSGRKLYPLFHYWVDWTHPMFDGIEKATGQGGTEKKTLARYVKDKCDQEELKWQEQELNRKEKRKVQEQFKTDYANLIYDMALHLVAFHQPEKSRGKTVIPYRADKKDVNIVTNYMLKYRHNATTLLYISNQFYLLKKIRDEFGRVGEVLPFDRTTIKTFLTKLIFDTYGNQNGYFRSQYERWKEGAGKREQGETRVASPQQRIDRKDTRTAFDQAPEYIKKLHTRFNIGVQTSSNIPSDISRKILTQRVIFHSYDEQNNELRLSIPAKDLNIVKEYLDEILVIFYEYFGNQSSLILVKRE